MFSATPLNFVISETFSTQVWAALRDKHFPPQKQIFLYEYPLHWTRQRCSLLVHSRAQSPFWLLKPASEHADARLLPRLSWSWTVLLPSDTHRKPITSITVVLLQFVTYLLTLPRKLQETLYILTFALRSLQTPRDELAFDKPRNRASYPWLRDSPHTDTKSNSTLSGRLKSTH
jgi:hypothetical protein